MRGGCEDAGDMNSPVPTCGICGANASRQVYFWKEWRAGKRHAENTGIQKCSKCGVWFTWPPPSPEYDSDYDQEYDFQQYKGLPVSLRHFRELLLLNRIACAAEKYPLGRRFLDIGCSTGVILELARSQGFEAEGFEISKKAAETSRNKGFRVSSDSLRNDYAESLFDVVYASHVIEHTTDPLSFLTDIARILKPGGHLMLACPNRRALLPLLRGRNHPWDPDCHYFHFAPREIIQLCKKAGFACLHFHTEDGSVFKNPVKVNFLRLMNQLGFGDNTVLILKKQPGR